MGQIEKLLEFLEEPMAKRFQESLHGIEILAEENADRVAEETILAFREAAWQALELQNEGEKGPIRYCIISHLYSSIQTGKPAAKIDLFDERLYADSNDIDVYLPLGLFYRPLDDDIRYFKEVTRGKIVRIQEYEWEQVRYRHVWSYHAVVRKFLQENVGALVDLLEYEGLAAEAEFEVLFGGYMDRVVRVWPRKEDGV